MKYKNILIKQFLIILFLIKCSAVFAQAIPASNGTTTNCHTCAPPGWTVVTGTPDISNRNTAAATGTLGGGSAWNAAPLPLPSNSHTNWITIRDVGTLGAEEIINTTMTGLVVGREYEVIVYSNSSASAGYSPNFIDLFEFQVQGLARVPVTGITQNVWGTSKLRFVAANASRTLSFYPGNNSGSTSIATVESVNISVSLNAINAVPVAAADNTSTLQNIPVSINVTTNDSDPDGAIVVSTVDLNTSTVGIQNTFTNAQGTWTVDNLGVVTFTPVSTFIGVATLPYTVQDNYTLDGNAARSTSTPANLNVTVAADTDGDGISDDSDLDSDNDGILDIDECTDSVVNQSFSSTNGTTVNFSAPAADLGFIFDVYTLDNSFNLNINGVSLATSEIQFQSNQTDNIRFVDGSRYGIGGIPEIYSLTGNATNPLIRIVIQKNGSINLYGSKSSNGPLFPLELYGGNSLNTITWNKTGPNSIVLSQIVVGTTYITGNGNGVKSGFCDPDGDGISNQFDLDSDGDGCFDAIEGNENVTSAQLNANGSINTAANGGVNTNGVPNLVNAGGAADIGSDLGQGIGTSQNSAVQDVQCSTAIGCTNALYLSQAGTLYSVNTTTNPFTYPTIGVNQAGDYNAIGISPIDGRMYGMLFTSNNLIVINANGTSINLGPVANLPVAFYNAGEIDNLGNYYVKASGTNNLLYRINVTTLVATPITLSTSIGAADIAFRTADGLLYAVSNTGQLTSINPATGTVTGIGAASGAGSFGAMFGSSTGEIYGSDNASAGGFYQFNVTTGQRVLISGSPTSSSNDGAHCVTAPIAFSADLSVTKTDGVTTYASGTSTTYTVTVTNNGPFGVLSAGVSDPVPAGIPAANVSYTASVAGGASTSVTGTQTGAINDIVNLPVNATVTYTVTVSIPFTFTGNLVNTVTVTPPANSTDADTTNNTATDTDTQAVCYRPGLTTGGAVLDTNHGITSLGRAGSNVASGNWPMVRKGAWTVLESKTKGFVLNRLTTAQISDIPSGDLVEGMMVYNVTLDCLQVNINGTPAGWSCFNTQTCPTN